MFSIFLQSQTEDGIRKELLALQEDKHNYETTTKESLRRVLQEKIEVVRKLAEVEVGYIIFLNAQCKSMILLLASIMTLSLLLACSGLSVTQRTSAPT